MRKLWFNPLDCGVQALAWETRRYQLRFKPKPEFVDILQRNVSIHGLEIQMDGSVLQIFLPVMENVHWERIEREIAILENKVMEALATLEWAALAAES